jgi:hypothetical protein
MSDKRSTSQQAGKEASWGIVGTAKTLQQLSSSGQRAQDVRGKTAALRLREAASSQGASSQGGSGQGASSQGDNINKGGNEQKK